MTGLQYSSRVRSDPRRLVNLQAKPVTSTVEEALHAAVVLAGPVTFPLEELLDCPVHLPRRHSGPHLFERQLLAPEYSVIQLSNCLAGAAADDRAGDVAKISGLLRAGKNIEDDRLVGAQRTIARLMRVAALPAAGDNRVAGKPSRPKDRGIDDRPKLL